MAYTAQAPVAYTAQAPVAYTAQVPSTYTLTAGAAPVGNTTTGAAPIVGNSPGAAGVRISNAVRNALYADLVAYYHSDESGTTRLDKMRAVRDRAREEFEATLEGEDDPELNDAEKQDLRTLVDWVISGGAPGSQHTYYPPLAAPVVAASGPSVGIAGGMTVLQPTTLYVPVLVSPAPYHHKLFH